MLKGVDISRWQGFINWPILKQNVNFVMIKLGGSDDGFYQDGMAVRNVIEARSQGLLIGFYVFLGGAQAPSEEVAHIKNLFHAIGGLHPGEIFSLDWEKSHNDEVGYMTGIVEGLTRAGMPPPLIYMSQNRIMRNDWRNLTTRGCPLWVANWGNNDQIPDATEQPFVEEWGRWVMWQYSSTGNVAGIPARVDLNIFNGDAESFKALGLKSQVSVPAPAVIPTAVFASQPLGSEYIVQPNDNLSAIAARFGRTWQELWALNRDRVAQPNRIFPGQKLLVWSTMALEQPKPQPNQPASVALPQIPANPPQPTATHQTYTVVNGDNLSSIAYRHKLPNWHVLYNANRQLIGSDPNRIYPGQVLTIPQ